MIYEVLIKLASKADRRAHALFGLHLLAGETPDPYASPRVAGRLRSRKPAANEKHVHESLPPREAEGAHEPFTHSAIPMGEMVKSPAERRDLLAV